MDIWIAISGLVVGMIIGTTGMGGGIIMTPLLLFGFGVSPAVVVGTDLIFASVTKSFGAWQHWRQRTIDFNLILRVAIGSIPGTLTGLLLLLFIKQGNQTDLNLFITKSISVAFILISIVMLLKLAVRKKSIYDGSKQVNTGILISIGFLTGLLVAITSVGSGTLFIALLLWLYPYKSSTLVGTDILHGVLITGVAGLAHSFLGTIDYVLLLQLLIGSIPGVLIGSRITVKVPDLYIRILLITMMLVSSFILLFR
ncbi:sulfite exporter TauE/SafE family protein [Ferdinandcohnia sp. SAFN-114]|uniref:sulfite exporter TauE/SafE family protein n=1 Tax=Ferdinandcohnia sp. SAFN-114 TaxID=3387275 RepID=UPI003F81CAA2